MKNIVSKTGLKSITSKAAVEEPEKGRRQRQLEGREARAAEAMEASRKRAERGRMFNASVKLRVEKAQGVLNRPLARARELLDGLSPSDLQVYLLAEQLGQNRRGVLQGYPEVSRIVREQYEQETRPETPSAVS